MPPVFDAYVMVDWSAAAVPASGADSIWIAASERTDGVLPSPRLVNTPTRRQALAFLADLLADLVARDRTVLAGFDFAFGYPGGFARMLRGDRADWHAVWSELALRIRDGDDNANNRFAVAAALNERISGKAFPFWGCPPPAAGPLLSTRKPVGFAQGSGGLAELRLCDRAAGGSHPVWKLAYPGCVGSQTLMGIAYLHALRQHPWLNNAVRVWPFETGLRPLDRPAGGDWRVLLAEIYPSIFDHAAVAHPVKDARQVLAVVEQLARLDDGGRLTPLFAGPASLSAEQRRLVETEEAWILGIENAPRARAVAPAAPAYDYLREPQEIYRRSFAMIRAEADLSAVPPDLEPLVVRLIHAAGNPGIVSDLAWTADAAVAGRSALAAGANVLVDAEMVASGIIRDRLPAANPVLCTLREPGVAEAARAAGATRSAAAVERWRDRLEGAVVAIGNAPTALFRLLELLDAGGPRPAVILGFPVGFVGAAESKQALIAHAARIPYVTLRGRRGGSAFAAAAVNALGVPA